MQTFLIIGFGLFYVMTVIVLLWWHEREMSRQLDELFGPLELEGWETRREQ